jgi:hypothetical protein
MVFKCLACLVQEKINIKFLLASLKTLIDTKSCSESRVRFLFRFSFALNCPFLQNTFMASLLNTFQDQRRLSEQLLETQAAIGKPEPTLWGLRIYMKYG